MRNPQLDLSMFRKADSDNNEEKLALFARNTMEWYITEYIRIKPELDQAKAREAEHKAYIRSQFEWLLENLPEVQKEVNKFLQSELDLVKAREAGLVVAVKKLIELAKCIPWGHTPDHYCEVMGFAKEALSSTGSDVLAERRADKERIKELEELLERARSIMVFHDARCPMQPTNNFSGSEEHCAEYRAVITAIKKVLEDKPCTPTQIKKEE